MSPINTELDATGRFLLFKGRVIDYISNALSASLCGRHNNNLGSKFLSSIGEGQFSNHADRYDGCLSSQINFARSHIYKILRTEDNQSKFLFYLKSLLSIIESKPEQSNLARGIENAASSSGVSIILFEEQGQYYFLPKGASELNSALLNHNATWLNNFPLAKKSFLDALAKYESNSFERNLLDDLRLSLELLFKAILNNQKSLENQTSDLGIYMKNKGVSPEISNMYWKLLEYFTKYQNNYIKHNDKVNTDEVEFILYLTGVFIRFISKI